MTKKVELKLNAEQEIFVKGLNKEDRAEFDALENADKLEVLELQLSIDTDTKKLDGKIELESVGFKADGVNILVLGNSGIRGITAGRKITAMFMGMSYIFSDKAIENWTEVLTADGTEKKWRSEYARFRKTDGVEFGIFTSPMLRMGLRTLLTNSATPNLVKVDPTVTIEYHGKITKEVAEKDFNFKMGTGSHTHAVVVKKERGAKELLDAGIHNYLVSPIPTSKVDLNDMTSSEREALSYNNQMRSNNEVGDRQAMLTGNNSAQIAVQ